MKKSLKVLTTMIVIFGFVATVYAGSSGLTNTVTKMYAPGSRALRDATVRFNDKVVTWADTTATELTGTVSAASLSVYGDGLIGGNLTVSNSVYHIGSTLVLTAQTTTTVSQAFYVMEPGLIVTQWLANPTVVGQVVTFVNNAATNVIFLDAGNLSLSSAATLGVDDTLSLIAVTTSKWVETSQISN